MRVPTASVNCSVGLRVAGALEHERVVRRLLEPAQVHDVVLLLGHDETDDVAVEVAARLEVGDRERDMAGARDREGRIEIRGGQHGGLLAGVGHWFLIAAFLRAPATLVAPFTYLGMIWATANGYAIFGQLPDGRSALGMAVIVASGVGLVVHERHIARRPRALPRQDQG